ncbi:crotonase/enoyl-CoA hydratase family protein [Enterovirga rhinocerotis]|nr:crotonase/enoyl-CoA hydratase family protein [Enterovirga rhinocerotis]
MSLIGRNANVQRSSDDLRPIEAIKRQAGTLPQISLDYESAQKLLWITLRPEPKPVFTLPCVESVLKVQTAIGELWGTAVDRPVLFLAYRAVGPIFSLGGDLDFYLDCLSKGDRDGLARYAATAAEVIKLNRNGINGAVLSLTTVHARAMGGGIDPARACNVMIAEEAATFCYPEINYNHFPISAVPILSRHAGFIEAEKILLTGRDFTAQEFHDRGVVDAVVPKGTGEDWIRRYAEASMTTHSARTALIAAFNRQAGDIGADLARSSASWVAHMATLKPLEISKLQRIAAAQERMLGRLLRRDAAGALS